MAKCTSAIDFHLNLAETMPEESKEKNGMKNNSESTFGNLIPYRIAQLSHNTNLLITDYLSPHHLTLPQWRVLVVLSHFGKLGIGDIAKQALTRQSTLSRVIDRMEDQKLVKRTQDDSNKRLVLVSLSNKGRELYEQIGPISRSAHELLSSALTEEEQNFLIQMFDKMSNKLKEGRLS